MLTVGCSLWWIAGLWAQGGYGIEILRFTETARRSAPARCPRRCCAASATGSSTATTATAHGSQPSLAYTRQRLHPRRHLHDHRARLIGAAISRFRERAFFALLLATGVFLAVGGHPWEHPPLAGRGIKLFLASDIGLSMRSLPRAVPLVALAMAVFIGSRHRHRRSPTATSWPGGPPPGMCALAVLAPAAAVERPDGRPQPRPRRGHPRLLGRGRRPPRRAGQRHPRAGRCPAPTSRPIAGATPSIRSCPA